MRHSQSISGVKLLVYSPKHATNMETGRGFKMIRGRVLNPLFLD